MDVAEYINENPKRLADLAQRARMQPLRIKQLCRNPGQAVRYMTARRLCAASDGRITMDALARRGDMPGIELYAGPLGQRIAKIASTGPDVSHRLDEAGVRREQFTSMMLAGRMPRPDNMRRICKAFGGEIIEKDFREHAEWRRCNPVEKDDAPDASE